MNTSKAEEILGGFAAGVTESGLHVYCCRCGEELTDPASINYGVGPVCRKLANSALAAAMAANTTAALVAIEGVELTGVLNDALVALRAEIVEGAETRKDWRNVVNVLVRLASYAGAAKQNAFILAIAAMGYPALAAVAAGEASSGKAELAVEGGKLTLQSPRNKAAVLAIKKIEGRWFDGNKKVWSFPVKALREVLSVVSVYYPASKVNVMELAAECGKVAAEGQAAATTKTAPVKVSKVKVVAVAGGVNVFSPYNATFVADLKGKLPYHQRKWNAADKCWWVGAQGMEVLIALVKTHYAEELSAPVAAAA